MDRLCYCCSGKTYRTCCEPYHTGKRTVPCPEALMRSRYSAYCIEYWSYVLNTYAETPRKRLTESKLADYAKDQKWLVLSILSTSDLKSNQVEFKAYYTSQRHVFVLHETSDFVKENQQWKYLSGELHNDTGLLKISRNSRCFCNSGKKYKQCCLLLV